MTVTMKNLQTRTQDLREAFAGIISMMLGLLRAHGLRGLIHLPAVWLATREMKRIAEAFCELFAAWGAGLLAATPAPSTAPQVRQEAPAQPARAPRVAARRVARRQRH